MTETKYGPACRRATRGWRVWGGAAVLAPMVLACARNAAEPQVTLDLFPPGPTVQVGGNVQMRADPSRGPLQWTSSDTTVASVVRGVVQGISVGSAIIIATDGVDSGNTAITVTPSNPVPSLASNIQPIFNNYCSSCHTPPGAQENIDLSTGAASYGSLIGRLSPSTGRPLVVVGDTTNSYLYNTIRGTALNPADDMPQGCTSNGLSPCLPAPLIQLIASWILTGANP